MKLGIYCRISRIKDGNDLSIKDQQQKGIEKAKELKLPYDIYIDEGLSGASEKIEDRPEFERFIGDVTNGMLTHVFAYDQSRFERNPQIRFVINDLFKKHKIIYITQLDGIVDLHDPQQEFFGDLLSVINKYHVTTTKLKVKSALKVRVKEGKSRGLRPYGYTADSSGLLIIKEDEAEIVKRIYALTIEGHGARAISTIFNDEKIPTRMNLVEKGTMKMTNKYTGITIYKDKKQILWSPNTIVGIIKNTLYKGERNYSGEVYDAMPLFTKEYWEKANDSLSKKKSYISNSPVHQFLLKGLMRCGKCGRNYYGIRKLNKHDNHYVCSSTRLTGGKCGNRRVNIDKIETILWDNLFASGLIVERLSKDFFDNNTQTKNEILKREIKEISNQNTTLSTEKEKAINLVIKGLIQESDIQKILFNLDKSISDNTIKINELSNKISLNENSVSVMAYIKKEFNAFLNISSFEAKRKIVNDIIENILVNFDEEKGEFLFKIDYKININQDVLNVNMKDKLTFDATTPHERMMKGVVNNIINGPHTSKSNL
ncbi:recombinase family protein [Flavobacterium sp. ASV13]|uniref:recombinase family protein n=1 Tax=Flavobacterium sp. ASV13 TaxID=1506583 RepID=UPI000555D80E|nr:recombinase family protein [Flavobacterium sp. ASV13]